MVLLMALVAHLTRPHPGQVCLDEVPLTMTTTRANPLWHLTSRLLHCNIFYTLLNYSAAPLGRPLRDVHYPPQPNAPAQWAAKRWTIPELDQIKCCIGSPRRHTTITREAPSFVSGMHAIKGHN